MDFSGRAPSLTLHTNGRGRREINIPLTLEDGSYGISMEPIQTNDPRYEQAQKCDVTPSGDFILGDDDHDHIERWRTKVLAYASSTAMIIVAPTSDYEANLEVFCADFLAPPSIPAARRQYNVNSDADMSELSIRFMGSGSDRLRHTVGFSQG